MKIAALVIALVLTTQLLGGSVERKWHVAWGTAPHQVTLLSEPEENYGPQAFRVYDGQLYLLDNGQRKLKIFQNNTLLKSEQAPVAAQDFIRLANGHWAFLAGNQVISEQKIIWKGDKDHIMRAFDVSNTGAVTARLSNGQQATLPLKALHKNTTSPLFVRTERVSPDLGRISAYSQSGDMLWQKEIYPNPLPLASVSLAGQDADNNIYMYLEYFINQVPLQVKREIRVYNKKGHFIATIELAPNNYALVYRDWEITPHGAVYQMVLTPDGIDVLRWTWEKGDNLSCPKKYFSIPPAPYEPPQEPENHSALFKIQDFPPVSPSEALAIGDKYDALIWTCGNENLTNGTITAPDGYKIDTPDWLSAGTMHRMPYKWGGFETIQQFKDGIKAGKYAGDTYTHKCCGSSYAVGVDCSGFVSRCWKLPTHYSTRMMDDNITKPYDSWDQVRPADACHKVGHVRLIVGHRSNGSLDMIESAGFNWRVSYTNYYYYQITYYTPRYYIHMQGVPGNIPQPSLKYVLAAHNPSLYWTGSNNGINTLLQASDSLNTWVTETVLLDTNSYSFEPQDNKARFYRLLNTSLEDTAAQGIPSDTYGYFFRQGRQPVLIVDGFDRTAVNKGSWAHSYHHFAAVWGMALKKLGIPFETISNEALLDSVVLLQDYEAVFWLLGDESTADETFNSREQELVKDYLRHGGRLFVSGSEIGWDLDYKGSSADKDFISNFLKTRLAEDDSHTYQVRGAENTLFAGLSLAFDDGKHGVYQEDYPDALRPVNGGEPALYYTNGQLAAVYYSGTVPQGSTPCKVFLLGFPFETIYHEEQRIALMQKVTAFLELEPMALDRKRPQKVRDFYLLPNYPNPFNPVTWIPYHLSVPSRVTLKVYDQQGRLIGTLLDSKQAAGHHRVQFSAPRLASGIYYVLMVVNGKIADRLKITLLR